MEDTQVLDAESKAAPLQAPEAIDKTNDILLGSSKNIGNSTPSSNIYGTKTPVGEVDHASEISNNINRNNYDMSSKVDQSTEPTVTTQSTTRGNVTDETTWKSQYTMDDQFKATDDSDYSWNKIAEDRSQYSYDQEATQVLSDYAKSMQEIKEAGAAAMDSYFSAAYTANQTSDKMGWQGGQVESTQAKTAFLKASTAANMYSKFELQEYGIESQLSVARMYAEANMEALALELYQDELNRATREAELTGFYISPEASEIMKQQKAAEEILKKTNLSDAERKRANQVISAGNAYFDKLGFEKEYRDPVTGKVTPYPGVKTLAAKEYEETVRANKENERLQEDANKIADQARKDNNYNASQLRNLQREQLNYTKNQTEILNNMEAWRQYGGDESTGVGNFTKDSQGNYKAVGDVQTYNGHTYATIGGKRYEVEVDSKGDYYTIKGDASAEADNKKAQSEKNKQQIKETGNKIYNGIKDSVTNFYNSIFEK